MNQSISISFTRRRVRRKRSWGEHFKQSSNSLLQQLELFAPSKALPLYKEKVESSVSPTQLPTKLVFSKEVDQCLRNTEHPEAPPWKRWVRHWPLVLKYNSWATESGNGLGDKLAAPTFCRLGN